MTKVNALYKTEYDLVKALVRKEPVAYRQFYKEYSSKLLALVRRYVGDLMAAEDITVEAVMKIFDKIDSFKFMGSFEGWVRRLVINETLTYLKHNNAFEVSLENADRIQQLEDPLLADYERLLQLIDQLPVGYRTVFNLYVLEGYSHTEIANMLQISEGTSKSQLARARLTLQEKIRRGYDRNYLEK